MIFPKIYIEFEHWRKHKETNYYVSNLGNVRDSKKNKIEPFVNKWGYFTIIINDKCYSVHRLVAECWCERDSKEKDTIDHLDSNKRNNRAKNLQWVSTEENCRRADEKYLNSDLDNLTLAAKKTVSLAKESVNVITSGIKVNSGFSLKKQYINTIAQKRFGISAETFYAQAKAGKFVFRKKGDLPEQIETVALKAQKQWGLNKTMPIDYWEQRICYAALRQPEKIKFCNTTWFVEKTEDAYR